VRHLVSILSSMYWALAVEQDGAVNGFTLTGGLFSHRVQVEYATGQSTYSAQRVRLVALHSR